MVILNRVCNDFRCRVIAWNHSTGSVNDGTGERKTGLGVAGLLLRGFISCVLLVLQVILHLIVQFLVGHVMVEEVFQNTEKLFPKAIQGA